MSIKLRFLGKHLPVYRGIDGTTPIHLKAGDCIGVSEEKAKRLLADFPHDFETASSPVESKPAAKWKLEESTAPETVFERSQRTEPDFGKVPKKNKAIAPKKNKRR